LETPELSDWLTTTTITSIKIPNKTTEFAIQTPEKARTHSNSQSSSSTYDSAGNVCQTS
ncbi:putative fermentation associated protein (Csf1), partial [Corchorus capsularis]